MLLYLDESEGVHWVFLSLGGHAVAHIAFSLDLNVLARVCAEGVFVVLAEGTFERRLMFITPFFHFAAELVMKDADLTL